MKVLILSNHFNTGGITSYILNLSRGLGELGVKVYLASSGGNALEYSNCEHIKLPLETKSEISPKLYFSYLKLKPLVKEIDLIHANTRITRVLAHKLSSRYKPYIATIHGYHRPKIKNKFLPYWGKKIIAVSNFVKQHLISDFKVSPDKIKVIYNGIDVDFFRSFFPDAQTLKVKAGYKDKFLVLAVARLSDIKGFQYLLKAFKLFLPRYPQALLLIAGEGKEKFRIQKLIKLYSLETYVKLLGVVRDIRPLLRMCDIFIQPSLIEGLGISIIEAQAMGKPIIATNTGGIPEIITDGYSGVLVKPGDPEALKEALWKLADNQELRDNISRYNISMDLLNFHYKIMTKNTYQLYKEVTANKSS